MLEIRLDGIYLFRYLGIVNPIVIDRTGHPMVHNEALESLGDRYPIGYISKNMSPLENLLDFFTNPFYEGWLIYETV